MDEGYIKYLCKWIKAEPVSSNEITEINSWRDILFEKGLIGAYDNGIGYGNISRRYKNNSFIITGSATGGLNSLNENHYTLVSEYNLLENSLTCYGPIKASSESLSHAVIYGCSAETNAVIHIHNLKMWESQINKLPTTNKNVTYGTPEMAYEIKRLFKESNVQKEKILIMGGHEEGIISFGKTIDEAGKLILEVWNSVHFS
jgi:L-ribulose-5-phosphate 4-epimerase